MFSPGQWFSQETAGGVEFLLREMINQAAACLRPPGPSGSHSYYDQELVSTTLDDINPICHISVQLKLSINRNKLLYVTFRLNVLWICDVGAFLYIYFKLFVLWKLTLFDWYKPLTFCQFLLLLHFCWSASNWWVVRGAILCVVPVMSQQEMVLWRIKGEWRGRTGLALDNLYHSGGRG